MKEHRSSILSVYVEDTNRVTAFHMAGTYRPAWVLSRSPLLNPFEDARVTEELGVFVCTHPQLIGNEWIGAALEQKMRDFKLPIGNGQG
jgi:hypothetical protein